MRVIAATFKDDESADRALEELRTECDIGEADAELAPLGAAGMESEDSLVLAGRFSDDRSWQVRELVERHGGTVVTEVDAAITGVHRTTPTGPRPAEDRSRPIEIRPRPAEDRSIVPQKKRRKTEPSGLYF